MGVDDKCSFCAIVVGHRSSQSIQQIASLLSLKGISYIICRDVYCAAGQLVANAQGKRLMIIGELEELSPENFRLLSLAAKLGHICCCLTGTTSTYTQKKIATVEQMGAEAVKEIEDIGHIIDGLNSAKPGKTVKIPRKETPTSREQFFDEKHKVTEAELTALLKKR